MSRRPFAVLLAATATVLSLSACSADDISAVDDAVGQAREKASDLADQLPDSADAACGTVRLLDDGLPGREAARRVVDTLRGLAPNLTGVLSEDVTAVVDALDQRDEGALEAAVADLRTACAER